VPVEVGLADPVDPSKAVGAADGVGLALRDGPDVGDGPALVADGLGLGEDGTGVGEAEPPGKQSIPRMQVESGRVAALAAL
jgi:hypothetical protein